MEKIDYNNKNMRSYKKCKDANQKEDTFVEYEEVGKKKNG